jgi:hypothetical protein
VKKRTYNMSEEALEVRRNAGAAASRRKTRAVRKNGRLGGRPGNPEIKRIMEERGCSRQRAHQILNARG